MAAFLTHTIVNIPTALEELGLVVLTIVCFVALHALLQRRLRVEQLRQHNDVTGYLFSAVGILYAVLLGFVVVVVWQKYDATGDNVQGEVNAASDLYHVVDGFPSAIRVRVRNDLVSYAQTVVRIEWPAMADNRDVPDTGSLVLDDASYRIDDFSPTDQRGLAAQQAAIATMARLLDARRERLTKSEPAVPVILWVALIAGALSMVAFCYIFGVENRPAQLLMTAILVGLIALLFVVVYEFAGPFGGSVTISSDGWQYLTQHVRDIR